ncbi:MAG: HNH endonuclease [Acidimicrobiales bacterium]
MAIAELLRLDEGSDLDPHAPANTAFADVIAELVALPVDAAISQGAKFQNRLAALEAELLAAHLSEGGSKREVENRVGRGSKTTKKDAAKKAKRADAVKENPELAHDLAEGQLGPEQLDAIADAASRSDGEAAKDQNLINRVKNGSPDDAVRLTREWLDDHQTDDDHEQRRTRQLRQRLVKKYQNARGNHVIHAEGDDETVDEIWKTLSAKADGLYRADGGRNTAANDHRRTRNQRLYDALHQLTTRSGDGRSGSIGASPVVHIGIAVDDHDAASIRGHRGNGSVLPTTVMDRYLCTGTFIGSLFDTNGQILWHGRRHRHATSAQHSALIARDKGCVLCGADPSECVAHHAMPWNAPGKGKTDIEELALVCTDCHHHIHDNKLTAYHDLKQRRWRLRPSTPNEIPPTRTGTRTRDGPREK